MKVTIEDRNGDGRGRGRSGRRWVLVSQAHPGEEVTVRVDRLTQGTVQGRVQRLLVRDPTRQEHPCRHEFHCTGCAFLAAQEADEKAFKERRVTEAVAHLGSEVRVDPLVRSTSSFAWRHLSKQVFGRRGAYPMLGSYVAGTHEIVDNEGCPVLAPALSTVMAQVTKIAQELRARVHEVKDGAVSPGLRYALGRLSRSRGDTLLTLVTSESPPVAARALAERIFESTQGIAGIHVIENLSTGNSLLEGPATLVRGTPEIIDTLLGYEHRIGVRSFFQVNPAAAEMLFRTALELAGEGEACVEGYAGVGALTLPLSERFERVLAIESNKEAAESITVGAARHGRTGVQVENQDIVPALENILRTFDPSVAVMDPPRAGLPPEVIGTLRESHVARLVLLSCHPDALERDSSHLRAGGFEAVRVVPVDQFPRTAHVETVTLFVRTASQENLR